MLEEKDERGVKAEICFHLGLDQIMGRKVSSLSPGELQRFAIGITAVQKAQVYVFNRPSLHLDVKQRLKAAQVIRSLSTPDRCLFFLFYAFCMLFFRLMKISTHLFTFEFQLCNGC